MLHVTAAKYFSGYKIWVAFDDDTSGEVDLEGVLKGSVFEPVIYITLIATHYD